MRVRDLRPTRGWSAIVGALAVAMLLGSITVPTSAATATGSPGTHRKTTQSAAVAHATSPALGSVKPTATTPGQRQVPNRVVPPPQTEGRAVAPGALQGPSRGRTSVSQAPAASRNFAGLGEGFVGPQGAFKVAGYPPDPNGDVGPNHYVQMVNYSLAVFDKAGTVLHGPVLMKTLWSSLGGLCATDNNTDPIVLYDQLADRWVMSQLAYQIGGPDFECVAVSTTSDPLGTYALYAYSYDNMNDYPKMAVWPDGYYLTYVMYDSTTGAYIGGKTCALDRSKMLANLPATQQCADYDGFSYLPSDLDGPTPPPAGSPNYILGGSWTTPDQLDVYRFHVDWATP
ncbi:MAG: hypothetical protein WCP28_00475, partial [Actinomycetes bacterium]